MNQRERDLIIGPIAEGGLVLVVAAVGWATQSALIFASLGPTIYEIVEQPQQKSARLYNVIVGHYIAIGAGFLGVWAIGAWNSAKVETAGYVPAPRIWAAVIAVAVTTLFTLLAKASQPAALSTTLLISLGSMQTAHDAGFIAAGVALVAILGEPVRRYRLAKEQESTV